MPPRRADKAQLGVADALSLKLAHYVLDAVERDGRPDLRLAFGRLVRNGTRDGLPRLADADFRRHDCLFKDLALGEALAERPDETSIELAFAVYLREVGVGGAGGPQMVVNHKILVRAAAELLLERGRNRVFALFDQDRLADIILERAYDRKAGDARG
ncbi:MAG: hypothetical protein K6G91_10590 [Kiritimatiellae bacterium]|nr:hypothetical protein [Kiritimatiellia bacterium]